jgi:urea transporter
MEWSTDYGEKGSARNALRIAAITGVLAAPSAILLVDGLGSPYLGICVLAGLLIVAKQARLFANRLAKGRSFSCGSES